ncbi:MAG TPA: LLM class flavin-dependent oxidoreductase [Thermoanaerobaculia bacterium]|nr:LLM class flavin-dependent oxidoreductase [Thermoanaerobaculia bacterium]
MPPLRLGILDQIPVRRGQDPAESIRETIELAALADQLGYHRYWLAEHHATAALACTCPEVLLPLLGARTSGIRIGAGGIMLPHYSPLKVAECFRTLELLYPGRVDLGLGRAPGSDPLTAAALAYGTRRGVDLYPQQVIDLLTLLGGPLGPDHPFRGVSAHPPSPTRPEVWLLGSSLDSAALAAELGCAYSHATFIEPATTAKALALYRQRFRGGEIAEPRSSAAVSAVCAPTDEEAERLALSRALWWILILRGQAGPIPSVEEALAFPYTDGELELRDRLMRRAFVGSPQRVRARIEDFVAEHHLDEVILLTITHDPDARRRSYELVAAEFGLAEARRECGSASSGRG